MKNKIIVAGLAALSLFTGSVFAAERVSELDVQAMALHEVESYYYHATEDDTQKMKEDLSALADKNVEHQYYTIEESTKYTMPFVVVTFYEK